MAGRAPWLEARIEESHSEAGERIVRARLHGLSAEQFEFSRPTANQVDDHRPSQGRRGRGGRASGQVLADFRSGRAHRLGAGVPRRGCGTQVGPTPLRIVHPQP